MALREVLTSFNYESISASALAVYAGATSPSSDPARRPDRPPSSSFVRINLTRPAPKKEGGPPPPKRPA
jgi:hypothetical protein